MPVMALSVRRVAEPSLSGCAVGGLVPEVLDPARGLAKTCEGGVSKDEDCSCSITLSCAAAPAVGLLSDTGVRERDDGSCAGGLGAAATLPAAIVSNLDRREAIDTGASSDPP
jgi:hypothetical protein